MGLSRSREECETLLRLGGSLSGAGWWRQDVESQRLTWSDEVYGIHGVDPAGFLLDINSAWAFYAPEDRHVATLRIAGALRSGGGFAFELPLTRADGAASRVACEGVCLMRDGAAVALLAVIQPVTGSARIGRLERLTRHLAVAREHAERSSEAKSRFLTAMSHELRTPLHGIMGYAQLLQLEGGLNAKQSARVEAMMLAGEHLLPMINSVLDVAEIETGHVQLRAETINLPHLMRTCLDLIRPAAERKSLTLTASAPQDAPHALVADPTRLRQVLLNLLGNAVKYTDAGSIELRHAPSADGLGSRLEVADTGPGIPADRRAQLFKDFDRLGASSNSPVEGAGLGLAISARLASLMGGRLGHEDNPGGGSLFWLELPSADAVPAPVPMPTPPAAGRTAAPAAEAARVLVVDDVAMNREIAGAFLQTAGYTISFATGGSEALAMASEQDFELALMDVCMPEMDGLEATRRIRALPGARGRLPIVALTAQTFNDQEDACRRIGMNLHLTKPFTCKALLDAVTQVLTLNAPADPPPRPTEPAAADASGPVCDHAVFEQTTSYVSREDASGYLRTLIARAGDLRGRLAAAPAATVGGSSDDAAAAHALAGSAGMFGFERLASTSRRYERSIEIGSPERAAIAGDMIAAIDASLKVMRSKLDAL